jgi:maltose O-acetyltransferase
MTTQREKMISGELYDPFDPALLDARRRASVLCQQLSCSSADPVEQARILKELIPGAGPGLLVQPPFHCDYGTHITAGRNVFFNANCVVLDVAPVALGDFVLCGPAVQIYTANHPLRAADRRRGLEFGRPVWIGDDVWIGGGAIILPGVRIDQGAVIGAGSVVTKNIPARVLAVGNPCRVIRRLAL